MTQRLKLAHTLLAILNDVSRPVFADRNCASRDASLSTGIAGIRSALAENGFDVSQLDLMEGSGDIFGTAIGQHVEADGIQVNVGDLFGGFGNIVWSSLCRGTLPEQVRDLGSKHGAIDNPGLAHGDLIRDFAHWINARDYSKPFVTRESRFAQGGWCNGTSGYIATTVITQVLAGNVSSLRASLKDEVCQTIDWASGAIVEGNLSLCHGASGALVVLAGLSRIAEDSQLAADVISLFDGLLIERNRLAELEYAYVDATWLTGSAGILWASAAVRRQPLLNPLLPTDSRRNQF